MKKLLTFFTYNNAVPLAVMFVMLGAASTYAATNPEAFVQREERVISIDNTYIANKDLNNYSPEIEILSVREDEEFYYVVYEFTTIELMDYIWQDVVSEEELQVPKRALSEYRDLGAYVTEELNEQIKAEIARLKETQVFEKRQVSQKQVATAYSGLVGGFLNDKVDTVPGYEPKVKPREEEEQTFARPDPAAVAAMERGEQVEEDPEDDVVVDVPDEDGVVATSTSDGGDDLATTTDPIDDSTTGTSTDDGTDDENQGGGGGGDSQTPVNTKPKLTILGDNPVRILVGGTYTDLGATVTDDHDTDLTVDVYLNGMQVNKVTIDTSATGTHAVMYESTDLDGAVTQKTRTVEVYAPVVDEADEEDGGENQVPATQPDEGEDQEDETDEVGATGDDSSSDATSDEESNASDDEVDVEDATSTETNESESDTEGSDAPAPVSSDDDVAE